VEEALIPFIGGKRPVATSLLAMAFLCGGFFTVAYAGDDDPVVSTTGGQIRGHLLPNGRAEFLGIPFAQPPVGDLRWHEPVPSKAWAGVRNAKEFGAPCAQNVAGDWNKHDAETSREDCLFLNVITPEWPPKKPLPVMFWIHGGGNSGGTASAALYKDGTLVDHGVVLVTANYRLGIFGFFAHPELTRESSHHSSGNYALLDQIAALQWVRDNIAKFGGDAHKVTVFGQSAGAFDAGLLMTSPLAKNLFHRVIQESGTAMLAAASPTLPEAEKSGKDFAEKINGRSKNELKYLRSLSADVLLKAERDLQADQAAFRAEVNIDGWVLKEWPTRVVAEGREPGIPLIVGNNAREFDFPASAEQLKKQMAELYRDLAPEAVKIYGLSKGTEAASDPLYGSVANQWAADTMFRCPAKTEAIWHSTGHRATYEYEFQHAIPGQEIQGAVHSADLPYVFGFYPKGGNISGSFGNLDFKIADTLEKYWTNFAKTGDPNGEALPTWPEFGKEANYIAVTQDGDIVARKHLRRAQCDLFERSLQQKLAH
jgi:para-nitrobenzyl esterase